ncbi:unnamed protein product [Agarophyton chilense]
MSSFASRSAPASALALLSLVVLLSGASALFCGRDNCYELLRVPRNASKSDVRRAYRRVSADLHPDKNPGDEAAAARFRSVSAAYEALLDDAKRAKYDDFLDNPTKYWQFLAEISTEVYAPKSNVVVVVMGILAIATLVHWLNMNHTYRTTIRRLKESKDFQQQLTRLLKSKQAATREHAEAMINLDVVGLKPPHWSDLVVFKLLKLPSLAFRNIMWHLNWLVSYRIRKLDYSPADKLYLIQKNLQLSDEQWLNVSERQKQTYLKEQLWHPEKCQQFLRMERIQLNRLGKAKKKNKHTPAPYSEADSVNTSE